VHLLRNVQSLHQAQEERPCVEMATPSGHAPSTTAATRSHSAQQLAHQEAAGNVTSPLSIADLMTFDAPQLLQPSTSEQRREPSSRRACRRSALLHESRFFTSIQHHDCNLILTSLQQVRLFGAKSRWMPRFSISRHHDSQPGLLRCSPLRPVCVVPICRFLKWP
jgi:hypothetical protein